MRQGARKSHHESVQREAYYDSYEDGLPAPEATTATGQPPPTEHDETILSQRRKLDCLFGPTRRHSMAPINGYLNPIHARVADDGKRPWIT